MRYGMSLVLETSLTVRPIGILNRFIEVYANDARALGERHGFELLGAWRRPGGTGQQVMHLHLFESLASYEQARASLLADPASTALLESLGKEMSISEVSSVGESTAYATEARLERAQGREGSSPLTYLQRISRVHFPHRAEVADLLGKIVDAVEETGAISLVTAYQAIFGRTSDVTDLFFLPQGEEALPEANAAERQIEGGVVADRFHALLEDEIVFRLQPLPYSPLQ